MDGGLGNDFLSGGSGTDTADYFKRDTGFSFQSPGQIRLGGADPTGDEHVDAGSAQALGGFELDEIGYSVERIAGTSKRDVFDFAYVGNNRAFDGRGGNDTFTCREDEVGCRHADRRGRQ